MPTEFGGDGFDFVQVHGRYIRERNHPITSTFLGYYLTWEKRLWVEGASPSAEAEPGETLALHFTLPNRPSPLYADPY